MDSRDFPFEGPTTPTIQRHLEDFCRDVALFCQAVWQDDVVVYVVSDDARPVLALQQIVEEIVVGPPRAVRQREGYVIID